MLLGGRGWGVKKTDNVTPACRHNSMIIFCMQMCVRRCAYLFLCLLVYMVAHLNGCERVDKRV